MSVCRTAIRRRRQHKIAFRHLPPLRRPVYAKADSAASDKRRQQLIEKQKAMALRKGMKK